MPARLLLRLAALGATFLMAAGVTNASAATRHPAAHHATHATRATHVAKPHPKHHVKQHPKPHAKPRPLGTRAVAEAARHVGAPYVYGAAGPRAFDCSGLVQYVYARLGIALPRSSAEQYEAVRHLRDGDKRVGDLIFFRLGGGRIDHVGIYAGNGRIVVAPRTGERVRYQRIWTAYWVGRVA